MVRKDKQRGGQKDGQKDKQRDGQKDKQRKEQTERHTRMLPLSQYSHKTLGGPRRKDNASGAMDKQTGRERDRQTYK